MRQSEFTHGYSRLKAAYPTMPKLSEEEAEVWYDSLCRFSNEDFLSGVKRCSERERFRPTLSTLIEHCFAAQRNRLQSEAQAEELKGEVCPWCGGRGWFTQYEAQEHCGAYYDVCLPCQCARSNNPEAGKKILVQAQNDAAWYFDRKTHGWRRRKDFVEPLPPTKAEQIRLAYDVKQVGKTF